jgi:uncharacterized RDD family membrane protein YckC
MLAPLDLSSVFSGSRAASDVLALRYLVMGGLDPVSFLVGSVRDLPLEETLDDLSPAAWLSRAKVSYDSSAGGFSGEDLEELRAGFRRALSCKVSSREASQLWYCLRSLGVFPGANLAKEVLGVCMEYFVSGVHFLLFCDRDGSSFALWEGGSGRFSARSEGEHVQLAKDVVAAASGGMETFSVCQEVPPPPAEGEFCITVMTASGWLSNRILASEVDIGPVGVCWGAFEQLRRFFLRDGEKELEEGLEGSRGYIFDYESVRWVYPSLGVRGLAFLVDLFAYLAPWALVSYGLNAFMGPITPLTGVILGFVAALFFPVFLAVFESSGSHTSFGKRFFSMYVVSVVRGSGVTFWQALVRSYVKCYLSGSFGWLWGFCNPYGRMYHDVLVDTVVVFDEQEAELLASLTEQLKEEE